MKLKKRLLTLASLIDDNEEVYDIGCDHGYLDIFLTTYKNCKCHASDKSENALKYAIKNIKEYKLEDKIETIVSDGLKDINLKDNSTVVLSGMGTSTIIGILSSEKINHAKTLLLQSNNDHKELRIFLNNNNYKIIEELVIKEKDIYYITIKAIKEKEKLKNIDLTFGPVLRKHKDIETISYYTYLLNLKLEILKKVPRKNLGKKLELLKEIKWLKKITKERK